MFRDMMWRVAEFSGVQIITYTVMDNHFHMLIQVPEAKTITEDEVLRRMGLIYRDRDWERVFRQYERVRDSGSKGWLAEWLKKYTDRMWDLSEFMKTLKSRYTIWYNKNHEDRVGTLWSDRFRSVLVEPLQNTSGRAALALIACYIELNAVRAGIVADPKEYTWCGYRDALAGYKPARGAFCICLAKTRSSGGGDYGCTDDGGRKNCQTARRICLSIGFEGLVMAFFWAVSSL